MALTVLRAVRDGSVVKTDRGAMDAGVSVPSFVHFQMQLFASLQMRQFQQRRVEGEALQSPTLAMVVIVIVA
jgi:hypothetical protein